MKSSKLSPYHEAIQERVKKRLTTTRILRELRELGYTGGRTILGDHIRSLRGPLGSSKPVKRRFETRPAQEMQVDWTVYTVLVDGCKTRIHALACLLAWSRLLFVYFFRNEKESTLLEGLSRAFEAFQGVTMRVVFDNMATVVLGRLGRERQPVWHPRFLDFAHHYGFSPFLCRVRDPNRKGKDERVLDYLDKDFVRGSSFDSFDDLNQRAERWTREVANRRVHGTTRRIPEQAWAEERDLLIQLPENRFSVHQDTVRSVGDDATISIDGTLYTVPATLANKNVAVRLYAEHFEVLGLTGGIAFTRRYVSARDKGKLQIDRSHYDSLPAPPPEFEGRRLDELFIERFPDLVELVAGLQRRMKSLAHIHLRHLWRLAASYGDAHFLEAAHRAQDYRRYDAHAVRRILEREHPHLDDQPAALPMGSTARLLDLLGDVDGGSLDGYAELDTDDGDKEVSDGEAK